ncbi:NADH-quinone oxidoreductase subunit N [Alphaproteobacteria bacterium]|nr:NADH-quinone oxidoreductase subunit N [Alphaproteobacteria bacterium]
MIGDFFPEVLLFCYCVTVMLLKRFRQMEIKWQPILLLAAVACFIGGDDSQKSYLLEYRYYESLLKVTVLITAFLICHFTNESDFREHVLLVLSTLGCIATFSSCNLVSMLCSLELSVVPIYFVIAQVLAASVLSANARAARTIVYGIASTLIFVVSICLMYVSTRFSNFSDIRYAFSFFPKQDNLILVASTLMLLSICMKIGIFMCHSWIIDVLENKTSSTLMILGVLRFSIIISAYKLLTSVLYHIDISGIVIILSCISIVFGSVLLTFSKRIKKIIWYLCVCHSGIVLLCCSCKTYTAMRSIVCMALSDLISISGILMFLLAIKKSSNKDIEHIRDLNSLSKWDTQMAISLSVFFISMFGLLPLIGFWGKYYALLSLMEKEFLYPIISLVFSLLISLICAAKLLGAIWFGEPDDNHSFRVNDDTLIKVINLLPYLAVTSIPFALKIAYLMRIDLYFVR